MTKDFSKFEKLLLEMQDELESNIARLREEMEEMAADDSVDDREAMATLVSDGMDHASLLRQQAGELAEVNHALAKIKNGTYGICEKSGEPIPAARLRVEPHARCTVEASE